MSEATDGGVRCCRGRLHGVFSCFLPLDFMCIVFDGLLGGFYAAHFQILFAILLLLAFFFLLDSSGIGFRQKWKAAFAYIYGKCKAAQFLKIITGSVQ